MNLKIKNKIKKNNQINKNLKKINQRIKKIKEVLYGNWGILNLLILIIQKFNVP